MNQGFEQVMQHNLQNLNEAAEILDLYFCNCREKLIVKSKQGFEISFTNIEHEKSSAIHLFELVKTFGFNRDSVQKMLKAMNNEVGKMFYSATHCLLVDRVSFIIQERKPTNKDAFVINSLEDFKKLELPINAELQDAANFTVIKDSSYACIDYNGLTFPLVLRKWGQGDYFYPLGMSNKKKLSNFLIDAKVNRLEKENTWVLCSNNEIVWLVNQRIDNRYKVGAKTTKVLLLHYLK